MKTEIRPVKQAAVEKRMATCRHFNGTVNDTCKAGVNYWKLVGNEPGCALRLPCHSAFKDRQEKEGIQVVECSRREYPSRQEAIAEEVEIQKQTDDCLLALRVVHEHAKVIGLGKGNGGASEIRCPICTEGNIRYRVAAYNGHIHARCTTKDCVSWME